jgi:bifunctional enzyme CysN/CysC
MAEGTDKLGSPEGLDEIAPPVDRPLRLPIGEVRESNGARVLAGTVESGVLRVGDTLLFSPSNKTARVRSIGIPGAEPATAEARPGDSVEITLEDRLFLEPGEMASHEDSPPQLTTVFRAKLTWLGEEPLEAGRSYRLNLATQDCTVTVQEAEGSAGTGGAGKPVARGAEAEVVLRSRRILALDEYSRSPPTGSCILLDESGLVARGTVSMEGYPDQRPALGVKSTNISEVEHRIPADNRAQRHGHRGGVLWFTGLSGAGKSTLAMEVEHRLFTHGYHVYVLDGDNVRRGLNANLGFSPDDRAENIRRVGEVAALFADAGFICITAFISPYQADRDRARASSGKAFHEIYIEADLETCERRDPKGLYKKARAGEIADFTGVSAPYEPPAAAELSVDTANSPVEDCVKEIVDYIERAFLLVPARQGE